MIRNPRWLWSLFGSMSQLLVTVSGSSSAIERQLRPEESDLRDRFVQVFLKSHEYAADLLRLAEVGNGI